MEVVRVRVQCLGAAVRMWHPEVGDLELRREKYGIGGTDGQLLVVHHAESGSASAEGLAVLASIAASRVAGPSAPYPLD
ncbi:MmyB family transcriptional regulator [Curtobacterium luteum]|uniref:MmyB family transcriptional regulator n=1 Tax=Curtobacterium luteum TaxID=33881 RepID=UPI0020C776E1|nr:hypothetical protein [Curtobacterium luteum]